ncbi:hypothetical protein QYE76_008285 [Lolium multiflorum]|uniref:RNase H type-1 domain-containing protein n=1 Tax=Lolium multiflorum TaxID=4521 RepID=A0AAD8QC46_LOLMU|nr:hypothetical protein QYE76_008285 [Lolium multiflorum]
MGIQEAELRPTPTVFRSIVPDCCQPIGRITLEVMFGKADNFRTENIEFEVVDLVSPYHALLGRPALTKFMAVPHYGYLKLPSPKGVITLIHDAVALAKAAQADMPAVGNPAGTTHFQPADNTKKICSTRPSRTTQPAKCTFGVPAGQLLGYLVSRRGIEANPEKIGAIEKMELPQCLKDVQKFTGCLASLSRFVSRGGEALPMYQLLKKSDKFVWSPQADEAFRDLKRVLSTAPILASPASMEPMLLYIAATNRVSKQNYPHYQKVTYGVYMAAKKLRHYFQEHPIKVVATAPLAEIIGSKDANGRVAKWALELAAHTIIYEPRTAIKSQILADFFVGAGCNACRLCLTPRLELHFDGSKMRNGLGAGIVVTSPKGDRLDYVLQIHFAASNNVAEYEALIHGLKLAKEIGVRRILCFGNSDLVIRQASGDWDAKDANRPHTVSTSSSYPASSMAVNSTMCHGQTMSGRCPIQDWLDRQAIPRALPWRFSKNRPSYVTGLGFHIRAG